MEERRRFDRAVLKYFSQVVDRTNGVVLGYLVDMTTGGALLIGDFPLKVNDIFKLRLDLPENFADKDHLDFEAKAVWTRPDPFSDYHRTGLKLLDINPLDLFILERMIVDYGILPKEERDQESPEKE
jgi:hypothetical protein